MIPMKLVRLKTAKKNEKKEKKREIAVDCTLA